VQELSPFDFGLVVAYLVPGFVILWGFSFYSATVAVWLAGPTQNTPTIGGLFYSTLASVACGMIANVFRWAIIDTIHHHTGVRMPRWDFSLLQERLGGYELMVELHYRYHQFFANMLIALVFTYVAYRFAPSGSATHFGTMDVGFVIVCVVLYLGSRDALRKYYHRAGELLTPK
jgi:hypothetical protein